mmetsp:Transcript_20173/g.37706  ORF Transcript_20173/g.37706 Transcript_20173/m.37706 type:complete len:189 (-) Transcript_20173:19-585(-)
MELDPPEANDRGNPQQQVIPRAGDNNNMINQQFHHHHQHHQHHHQHHQHQQQPLLQQQQQQQQQQAILGAAIPRNEGSTRFGGETAQPGQPLRCVISKRFSNETILWYMSKEAESPRTEAAQEDHAVRGEGGVQEVFCFWAKLMTQGIASSEVCQYPSQTSLLARQSDGWHSLSSTINQTPPTLELLD